MKIPFAIAMVLSCSLLSGADAATVVVHPQDDGRALTNPDMGFAMYYYADGAAYGNTISPGDSLAWFPGCSILYMRLPWADLEPQEGVFNWSAVDTPAQQWLSRGGQVAFRVTVSESSMRGIPEWVEKAGAKTVEWKSHGKLLRDPVPDDPVFMEKFDRFLRAFASRYDGRGEVAFIDVGSLGLWGEGHTQRTVRLSKADTQRIARLHIDLHRKHFRRTRLIANDDYTGTNESDESVAIDHALACGLGWRDDSIMVDRHPWFHAKQAQRFWPTAPVILEAGHYSHCRKIGTWDVRTLMEAVEVHHASYLSIHGDPHLILEENRTAIDCLNRRMGYRLVPREVSGPERARVGVAAEPFVVAWTWANVGVAPCLRDAFPCLTVKDEKGGIVAVFADWDFNLKTLSVGAAGSAPASSHGMDVLFGRWQRPQVKAGTYDVYVSVGKCDGTPVFELPLPDGDGGRRYRLGRMTFVTDSSGQSEESR